MMDGSIMYTCIAYIIRDIFPRNEVFERGDKVFDKDGVGGDGVYMACTLQLLLGLTSNSLSTLGTFSPSPNFIFS